MRFFLFSVRPLLTPAQNYGILYKILCFQYMLFVSEYASPRITILMFFRRVCKTQIKKNTQAYFGNCRMLRTGFVFDEPLRTPTYSTKFHTKKYFAIRRRYSPWASMRNTNFKKYAGLSKWSQRGGLENR